MKTCKRCNILKDETEFGKETRNKNGLRPYCRDCAKELTAEYRKEESYRETERKYARDYNKEHADERKEYRAEYEANPRVKDEIRKRDSNWFKRNPIKKILYRAKASSKEHNVSFNLEESDITVPVVCPVLGIPLITGDGKANANSPSIDRIVPELGYVKGNIQIISFRANTIKNDATIEELKAVLRHLEALQVIDTN